MYKNFGDNLLGMVTFYVVLPNSGVLDYFFMARSFLIYDNSESNLSRSAWFVSCFIDALLGGNFFGHLIAKMFGLAVCSAGSVCLYFDVEFSIHSSIDSSVILKVYVVFFSELSKLLTSFPIG